MEGLICSEEEHLLRVKETFPQFQNQHGRLYYGNDAVNITLRGLQLYHQFNGVGNRNLVEAETAYAIYMGDLGARPEMCMRFEAIRLDQQNANHWTANASYTELYYKGTLFSGWENHYAIVSSTITELGDRATVANVKRAVKQKIVMRDDILDLYFRPAKNVSPKTRRRVRGLSEIVAPTQLENALAPPSQAAAVAVSQPASNLQLNAAGGSFMALLGQMNNGASHQFIVQLGDNNTVNAAGSSNNNNSNGPGNANGSGTDNDDGSGSNTNNNNNDAYEQVSEQLAEMNQRLDELPGVIQQGTEQVIHSVQQQRAPPSAVRQARSVGVNEGSDLFGNFDGSSPNRSPSDNDGENGDSFPLHQPVDTSAWLPLREIAQENSTAIMLWTDLVAEGVEIPLERFVHLQELLQHNFGSIYDLLQFVGSDIIRSEDNCAFMLGSSETSLFHPHMQSEEIITQFFDCAALPRLHGFEVDFDLPSSLESDADDIDYGSFSVTVASRVTRCAYKTLHFLLKIFLSSKDVTQITVEGTESKDQVDHDTILRQFLLPASDIQRILEQLPEREARIVLKMSKFGFDSDQVEELRSLERYKVDVNFYSCHEINTDGTFSNLDDEQEVLTNEEIARRELFEDNDDPCSRMEESHLGGNRPGALVRPRDMPSTWHEIVGFSPNQNKWQCYCCASWNPQEGEDGNPLTVCRSCTGPRDASPPSESNTSPTTVIEPTSGHVVQDTNNEESAKDETAPKEDAARNGGDSVGFSHISAGGFQFVPGSSSIGSELVASAFSTDPQSSAPISGGFSMPTEAPAPSNPAAPFGAGVGESIPSVELTATVENPTADRPDEVAEVAVESEQLDEGGGNNNEELEDVERPELGLGESDNYVNEESQDVERPELVNENNEESEPMERPALPRRRSGRTNIGERPRFFGYDD